MDYVRPVVNFAFSRETLLHEIKFGVLIVYCLLNNLFGVAIKLTQREKTNLSWNVKAISNCSIRTNFLG